jgi:lysophospholipase L1-like esterase
MIGLGGNDVMKLSSPKKWRSDMIELLGLIRDKNPDAVIFLSNCPMIKYSPAIPQPIRFFLWELSKMHDANIKEFTAGMPRVFYYPQPVDLQLEGFFADGLHPSEQGYRDWAGAMMEYFNQTHSWKNPTA